MGTGASSSSSSAAAWTPKTWKSFHESVLTPAKDAAGGYGIRFFPSMPMTEKMQPLRRLFVREFDKSSDEISAALGGKKALGTVSGTAHDYAGSYVLALCEGSSYASAIFVRRHASQAHELLWAVTAPEHRGRGCAAVLFDVLLRACVNDGAMLLVASTRKAVGYWLKLGLREGARSSDLPAFELTIVRNNPKSLTKGIEPARRADALRRLLKAVCVNDETPPHMLPEGVQPRFGITQTTHLFWVKRDVAPPSKARHLKARLHTRSPARRGRIRPKPAASLTKPPAKVRNCKRVVRQPRSSTKTIS